MLPWPNACHDSCRIEVTPSQWQELLGKHDMFVAGSPSVEASKSTSYDRRHRPGMEINNKIASVGITTAYTHIKRKLEQRAERKAGPPHRKQA